MKRYASLICMALAAITVLSSCSKDDSNQAPDFSQELQSMLDSLKLPMENITVNAGTPGTVTGSQGTYLSFDANSFKDVNGNIINSGTINIRLRELYTLGQMVVNNTNTYTQNGTWLTSAGQVQIIATQNNNNVYANRYQLGFRQPAASNQPMGLFYGSVVNESNNAVIWGNEMVDSIDKTNFHNNADYYLFDSVTAFDWINCDYWGNNDNPRTDIKVTLPDQFTPENTLIAAVIPSLNVIAGFSVYHSGNNYFSLSNYIPVGLDVKIVVLSSMNNTHYATVSALTTLTEDASFSLTPQEATISQISNLLSTL